MTTVTKPVRAPQAFASTHPRQPSQVQVIDGMCRIPRLDLVRGGHLDGVQVAWRLVGPSRGPVVVVLGGISANRAVAPREDAPGWWAGLVGPGKAVDTVSSLVFSPSQPRNVIPLIDDRALVTPRLTLVKAGEIALDQNLAFG